MSSSGLPGFLAVAASAEAPPTTIDGAHTERHGGVDLHYWGRSPVAGEARGCASVIVSRSARRAAGAVPDREVADHLRRDPEALIDLLPPFAAVRGDDRGVQVVTDSLGFQHVFRSDSGTALSTSALLMGALTNAPLDKKSVGIQSLLGWQLGERTTFEGVRKLRPGAVARMDPAGTRVQLPDATTGEPLPRAEAVKRAAALLRTSLTALLDDHPDAVLQLTGGMDSRLLLSAIPASRRRGLRAMTLDVPGKGDVAVARMLAERYGIAHVVRGLTAVDTVSPEDAWELCRGASTRLDAMSDPVALAAQQIAERAFDQGVRISGLGGEVARGFYYVGRVVDRAYSRADAERLADWRMFVNDAVEPGLLTDEFAEWAHRVAVDEVYEALREGGDEWFRATDDLYLRHRMQRWAGASDVAVSADRLVLNPMLDHDFLAIARRLTPQDKAHSRFLAELQVELDPELSHYRLDGRPAPARYAEPPFWAPIARAASTGSRGARKAMQRIQRGNRPPAGGEVMAAKVVAHWRKNQTVVSAVAELPFVRREWIEAMLSGAIEPRPSSVAFLTNAIVATGG